MQPKPRESRDDKVEPIEATDPNPEVLSVSDPASGQGADLIAIADVAAILSVSKQAAARIAAAGDFPKPFRLNQRTVKYSKTAVLAWLQSKQEP